MKYKPIYIYDNILFHICNLIKPKILMINYYENQISFVHKWKLEIILDII